MRGPKKLGRFFDLRSALAGALIMGALVALINAGHGVGAALLAAAKQAAYTGLIAGLVLRLCERLAIRSPRATRDILVATVVASLVTVAATTLLHRVRGTAEPWASVAPTLVLGPPSFLFWARRSRRIILGDAVVARNPPDPNPPNPL